MKQNINEIKRMQQLAGVTKENEEVTVDPTKALEVFTEYVDNMSEDELKDWLKGLAHRNSDYTINDLMDIAMKNLGRYR
jgi:hypothetical protein